MNALGASGRLVRISRFLSYALRHRPEAAGLALDAAGWAPVDAVLDALAREGLAAGRADLAEVVRTSDKKRFALSEDGRLIRAQQGHTVEVDLGYLPELPPARLFHGTVALFLPSIRTEGLRRGGRTHVHLSPSPEVAEVVARRRGKPVLLLVSARAMHEAGHAFFRTPNDVWLTQHVPSEYLTFP